MKILIVIQSLNRGGAERVVSLLSKEWMKHHEVQIVVFDSSSPAYSVNAKVIDLGLKSKYNFFAKIINVINRITKLRDVIFRENPDKIISFMESANFPTIIAAAIVGKLNILSVSVRNDPSRFTYFQKKLIPWLYKFPSKVIAVSKGVEKALEASGVNKRKLITIPNPAVASSNTQTNALSVFAYPYILGVGRLHKQKGFDRLIRAYKMLGETPEHLVILGEGPEREFLEQMVNDLDLGGRVHLLGAKNDVIGWYREARCFVLSSHHEGWPNVIMEAMSSGCPVISFNCNYGPAEIIQHQKNGLLVNQDDIVALSSAIKLLLISESVRSNLIEAGFVRVLDFDLSSTASKWLSNSCN